MSLTRVDHQEVNSLLDKLKNIKCVLLDVDGILTDGRVILWEKKLVGIDFSMSMTGTGLKCLEILVFILELFREETLSPS